MKRMNLSSPMFSSITPSEAKTVFPATRLEELESEDKVDQTPMQEQSDTSKNTNHNELNRSFQPPVWRSWKEYTFHNYIKSIFNLSNHPFGGVGKKT